MRVHVFNPNNEECTLIIREAHFQEENRESWREHVRQETDPESIVWFEDEDPPAKVLEHIQQGVDKAAELGYWPDGTPFDEDDDECQNHLMN